MGMKAFSASTEINASPETVWGILTDSAKFTEWDPGMKSIEGNIAPGEKLTIYAHIAPNRAFKVTVSEFEPNRKLVWSSGMPMGLFKGARTFTLTPKGEGTEFTTREEFGGLLLPLFGSQIPDMTAVFEAFNAGLKKRAEAG
jgi:hypothetical protein